MLACVIAGRPSGMLCQWFPPCISLLWPVELRKSIGLHSARLISQTFLLDTSTSAGSKPGSVWRVSPSRCLSSPPLSLPALPFFLYSPHSLLPFPSLLFFTHLRPSLPCTPPFPLEVGPLKSS